MDSADAPGLMAGGDAAKRPVFLFEGPADLSETAIPTGQLTLSGPSEKRDPAHWPVRGDLAHIRLAGLCHVPHYAVPMPHRVTMATVLRGAGRADAEALAELGAGESFDVLDIAGAWCWGEAPASGLVGYVAHAALAVLP